LAGAQETGLPLGDGAVRHDVQLPFAAEERAGVPQVLDEGGVPGDEPAGVDRRPAVAMGEGGGVGAPAGGGDEGGTAFPIVEAGVGGAAAHVEPPLEDPAPA